MTTNIRPFQHHNPKIAASAYCDASAVIIGQAELDADVSIWPLVVIRADIKPIKIGKRTNIQDGSVLHVTGDSTKNPNGYPVIIGEDVTIGHKVMLHGCTIGDRVLIGMGAILLDGVVVEPDVMVGAGSLVPPNAHLASGYLYLGSPAKQIRALTTEELAHLQVSAQNYVRLKQEYLKK